MNASEESDVLDAFTPPSQNTSDYIEIGYLIVLGVAGAVFNLIAYTNLDERRKMRRFDRLLVLKQHMNYTDLMVVFLYTTSRICWLVIYSWNGGDALCRLVKFGQALSFQSSSNVVVVIAIDRVMSVLSPLRGCRTAGIARVHRLLAVAWLSAIALSLPQIFVWRVFEPFPDWKQCTVVWEITRWELSLESRNSTQVYHTFGAERFYNIYHIVTIFWLPLALITMCYGTVIVWLWTRKSVMHSPTSITTSTSNHSSTITCALIRRPHNYIRGNTASSVPLIAYRNGVNALSRGRSTTCTSVRFASMAEETRGSSSISNEHAISCSVRIKAISCSRRHAVRVSCALVIAYVLCWLPYNSLVWWKLIDPAGYRENIEDKMYFINGLIVANSVINPFLYETFGKRTICWFGNKK